MYVVFFLYLQNTTYGTCLLENGYSIKGTKNWRKIKNSEKKERKLHKNGMKRENEMGKKLEKNVKREYKKKV